MSEPAPSPEVAAPPPRRQWTALAHARPGRQPWWQTLGIIAGLFAVVALAAVVVSYLLPPSPNKINLVPRDQLDNRWGSYLSEREWGTPREALNGSGWGLLWNKAITTDYRSGEDGIAGFTDSTGEFNLGWAFWDGAQDHVTERFRGLGNPQSPSGEGITDDRVYHENDPTHAYQRLTYNYPSDTKWFSIELETARDDSSSMTMVATVTNTTSETRTLDVVFKAWLGPTGVVEPIANGLLMRGATSSVAVVGEASSEWQISADKAALDTNLRGAGLDENATGNIGALAYRLEIPAGSDQIIRIGIAEDPAAQQETRLRSVGIQAATTSPAAQEAATILNESADIVAGRRDESVGVFAGKVSEHGPLYRQALMSTIWNETYYSWDGSSSVNNSYAGLIDAHDVLILPDKWEYPWPASWDGAFQSVTAALIDPQLAQDQLRFFLSDRWQQADGHIPCAEWVMDSECPPIFAWAAWRIYEMNHDTQFLTDVYPALQRNYNYWWSTYAMGNATAGDPQAGPALFSAGFLGMDNLPRPIAATAQADASAWMAFFARDMARIASELHDPDTSQRYWIDRGRIQEAINSTLWDDASGFYYDERADATLYTHKSYAGLVPLIAGVVPPERLPPILSALRDTNQFLSPAGIRSLAADDPLYLPNVGGRGVNSNWRGPAWLPLNYLLVESLMEVDPSLASDVRDRVVDSVEADWNSTGRLHEFFDGDTGIGLGADNQAGWTALVANMIAEGWPAPSP
ncbi:MAG: trehalase family glycosidase [Chloroflexota bacterium]